MTGMKRMLAVLSCSFLSVLLAAPEAPQPPAEDAKAPAPEETGVVVGYRGPDGLEMNALDWKPRGRLAQKKKNREYVPSVLNT